MIENNEAPPPEQPLDQSLMMSSKIVQQPEIQSSQPKDIAREVDNFIARLPSHFSQLKVSSEEDNKIDNKQTPEPFKEQIKETNNLNKHFLSRYNYTGKVYRFEIAEKQLEVSKPEPQPQTRTKTELEREEIKEERLSVPHDKDSIRGESNFDSSEMKFPSHNYYIMFDRKEAKKKKNERDKLSKTVCLENKVKRLQAQVIRLKQYGLSSTNGSFKKDKKMKLDQLLDSMLG